MSSHSQRVVRIDYANDKSVFPQFLNGAAWVNGAGDRSWAPYGLSRLLPYPGKTNPILVTEGQKCVEIAHSRGIPALCLEGGDYSHQTMFDKLRAIRDRLERLLLVVLFNQEYIYERVKELTVKQVSENEKMCVAGYPRRSEDAIQDIFHKVASSKKNWGYPKIS